jgi:rubrerythrin/GGDEF domain-containing protein
MANDQFGKKVVNQSNKEVYYISEYRDLDIKKIVISDAVILDYSDKEGCLKFVKQVRSSFLESIYLVPMFVLSINDNIDPITAALCDGTVHSLQEETFMGAFNTIDQRIRQLQSTEANDQDLKMQNKILRFYYTRQIRMIPILSSLSHIGYSYPFLALHFNNENTESKFKLLDKLVSQEFFRLRYEDVVHLCTDCYSGFLNYREVCPKCDSSDLYTENLIHHFVCAHIAPESDYINGDQMICPKCNRLLRHIGVDYDKPSLIYTCNNCGHHFQESKMQAVCMHCSAIHNIESLLERKIYNYELTALGEEAAIGGLLPSDKPETELAGFIGFSTFNIFLKYEIERIKNSGKTSSAGSMSLKSPAALSNTMGLKYDTVVAEIAEFVKNATLATDILTFINNNTFLIISPDNDKFRLESLLKNISHSVQKLIDSNINDANIIVKVKAENIDSSKSHNDLINSLLTSNRNS